MTVGDLIESRKEFYTIAEDVTVHEAARYLRERQIRCVGVCGPDGRLLGVVSQSDISDKVAAENKCPAWMRVSEIMTSQLTVVPPETSLHDCVRLMEKHRFFHLPVMNQQGQYCGMISVRDILTLIASDEKARADMLESFMFPQR